MAYVIIEGLDGSGSTYNYEKLLETGKFQVLAKECYLTNQIYNDYSNWWEMPKEQINKRLDFYLKRNIKQNSESFKLLKSSNVIQLKGFITTLIVHSYFLDDTLEELIDKYIDKISENLTKATIIFAIYAPSHIREIRFEERKEKKTLTNLDILTLNKDYEEYWKESIEKLNKLGCFGEIRLLDNTHSDGDKKIKKELSKYINDIQKINITNS